MASCQIIDISNWSLPIFISSYNNVIETQKTDSIKKNHF